LYCLGVAQNYFGKTPRSILCSTVVGFYDELEIVEAKNCLFTWVSNADLDFTDIPRNKPRKAGDNKRKFDTEDIMALFEYLDYKNMVLPDFVAKQFHRVPSANASDVDVCKLSDTVDSVRTKLENLQKVLKSVSDNQASLTDTVNLALSTRSINVQKILLNIPVSRDTVTDGACDTNGGETGDSDKVDDVAVANVAGSSMLLKSFADMFGTAKRIENGFRQDRSRNNARLLVLMMQQT